MTNAERLKKIESSRAAMRRALETYDTFQPWHAEIASLLSYDIILRAQFLEAAKAIIREGDFPVHPYTPLPKEMTRAMEQAMADLRVRAAEDLHNPAGGGVVSVPHSVPSPSAPLQPARAWVAGAPLESEHGILWFWHHCHYRVKWSFIAWAAGAVLTVFSAGFASGRSNLFTRLFDVVHETSTTGTSHQTSQPQAAPTTNAATTTTTK
jgi:hypothetical protein